jgi:small subunit ribosomal protein S15
LISTDKKADIIKTSQRGKADTGSPEVQVSIMTARINEITGHLKTNKHDFMARRGLLQLVGKRRRLLNYLANNDPKAYLKLVKDLGLRK